MFEPKDWITTLCSTCYEEYYDDEGLCPVCDSEDDKS